MASKKTVNAKNLEALGAERLAVLLVELAEADAGVKRRLRIELAEGEGPAAVAQEVRKRLFAIGKAQSFVDWRRNAALAGDLDLQRETIMAKIAPRDPSLALDLLWRFMALAPSIYERCDDSNGRIGGAFADGCDDLCRVAAAARPDPITLADAVFDALTANDYAQFDGLIGGMANALGPPGLRHLEARMRSWGETAPKAVKDADRVVGWATGSGPIRHADMERRRIEGTVSLALREIADALGDVDAFIAQHPPEARRMPRVAAAIAERLLSADRAAEALAVLDAADAQRTRIGEDVWEAARIAALEALGRGEEAQAFRWACFEKTLDASHLRAFLKKLPDFEDIAAEERALAMARDWPDLHAALHFLVNWPALDLAAGLVVTRGAELNGDFYELLSPAAEALADGYPLAATLALRSMIDFTLREARSSRYGHAARHLATCARMAGRVEDWQGIEDHQAYAARLKASHGRKSGFWSRVE
jgi:hypothetical protein